ncbi:MAG: hypothetical protein ABW199_00545 [Caulobacterales bacterium]
MQVAKLRIRTEEGGLVPAGEYFKRLAEALREANEREGRWAIDDEPVRPRAANGAHAHPPV